MVATIHRRQGRTHTEMEWERTEKEMVLVVDGGEVDGWINGLMECG
jgi:hypothetical protein